MLRACERIEKRLNRRLTRVKKRLVVNRSRNADLALTTSKFFGCLKANPFDLLPERSVYSYMFKTYKKEMTDILNDVHYNILVEAVQEINSLLKHINHDYKKLMHLSVSGKDLKDVHLKLQKCGTPWLKLINYDFTGGLEFQYYKRKVHESLRSENDGYVTYEGEDIPMLLQPIAIALTVHLQLIEEKLEGSSVSSN